MRVESKVSRVGLFFYIFTWLDGDFNCRSDRTRDIASVLGLPDKPMDVEVSKDLVSLAFARIHQHVTSRYKSEYLFNAAFPPQPKTNVLAEWLSSSHAVRRRTNHAVDVDTGHRISISLIKSASLCLSTPLSFGLPSACPPVSTVLIKGRQQSNTLSFEFCTLSIKPQCQTCVRIKRINEFRTEHSQKKVIVH
jgi:hypothetical protein